MNHRVGRELVNIDEELAALEAAERVATPGPWAHKTWTQDAAFIALARNTLPKLIAEVRLLREALNCEVTEGALYLPSLDLLRPDRKLGCP